MINENKLSGPSCNEYSCDDGGNQISKLTQVQTRMLILCEQVDHLDKVGNDLIRKLESVLNRSDTIGIETGEKDKPDELVPLASELRNVSDVLQRIIDKLSIVSTAVEL